MLFVLGFQELFVEKNELINGLHWVEQGNMKYKLQADCPKKRAIKNEELYFFAANLCN